MIGAGHGANNCVFGLMMQAYYPANSFEGFVPFSSVDDVHEVCDNWTDSATFEGCMIGAGYVYTRVYGNYDTDFAYDGFSQQLVSNIVDSTEEIISLCANHIKGYDLCVREISKQVPRFLQGRPELNVVCDLLGDFKRSNNCETV